MHLSVGRAQPASCLHTNIVRDSWPTEAHPRSERDPTKDIYVRTYVRGVRITYAVTFLPFRGQGPNARENATRRGEAGGDNEPQ